MGTHGDGDMTPGPHPHLEIWPLSSSPSQSRIPIPYSLWGFESPQISASLWKKLKKEKKRKIIYIKNLKLE